MASDELRGPRIGFGFAPEYLYYESRIIIILFSGIDDTSSKDWNVSFWTVFFLPRIFFLANIRNDEIKWFVHFLCSKIINTDNVRRPSGTSLDSFHRERPRKYLLTPSGHLGRISFMNSALDNLRLSHCSTDD